MIERLETILYSLGAVPVSELDKKFWNSDRDPTVYRKGRRVDVHGWLSPYRAQSTIFLSDADKERYGIPKEPLTYSEYVSLLDIDGYRTTQHPLQYAIMAFVLENMLFQGVEIEDVDPIIAVYEAHIGLEARALSLLKGRVSSDIVMDLYNKHGDGRLLDIFPVPQAREERYISFLQRVAEMEPRNRYVFSLLYEMDPNTYRVPFRDLMIRAIREPGRGGFHVKAFRGLVEIGDEEAIEILAESLLNDPVTENREEILHAAAKANQCSKRFMDSVLMLARGLGKKHEPETMSRGPDEWQYNLQQYLAWVKDNEGCDAETREEAERALDFLMR
jgi:hypothetical protein